MNMKCKQLTSNNKIKNNMLCTKCNITYKNTAMTKCGICGTTLIPHTENIPKCPTCQSIDIKKISVMQKAVHGYAFGMLSKTAHSQFECNKCGYKW